jgi:hypothetical protein
MKTPSDLLDVNCSNSFPFFIMFLNLFWMSIVVTLFPFLLCFLTKRLIGSKKLTCLRSMFVMSTKLSTIVGWLFLFERTFDSSFDSLMFLTSFLGAGFILVFQIQGPSSSIHKPSPSPCTHYTLLTTKHCQPHLCRGQCQCAKKMKM